MPDPRIWTLDEADAATLLALRQGCDDPTALRPITVRFSGTNITDEHFQRDMVLTGWEISEVSTAGNNPTIAMEWETTSDDDALCDLSARLRLIASSYGVVYKGWSIPLLSDSG